MRYKPHTAALGLAILTACAFAALPARVRAEDPAAGAAAGADPAQAAQAAQGDLRQRLIDLDNQLDDQEGEIRALNAGLQDVSAVANVQAGTSLPERSVEEENNGDMLFDVAGPDYGQAEEVPLMWRRLSMLINVDLEYTNEYDTDPASKKGIDLGTGNKPDYILPPLNGTPNGDVGMFFKHIDVHFKYKFNDTMFMKLDYNLSALELDDVGVGWQRLPLVPWGDYTFSIFVGQKRQFFGIEQQTDSRNLMFPNRAMMYGGHTPFAHIVNPGADPFELFDQTTVNGLPVANEDDASDDMVPELAYERVMGIHLFHTHDFGFLSYNAGVDIVNDESEDSQDGQVTDSLGQGFPLQTHDQDVSEIGRVGVEPRFLSDLFPFGSRFNFGASAFHDPENTA
jgi:hypothetical protein